ncbi:retrotransposon protein, putative, ty1-copia subclass [Tanacetum coccineum]
MKFLLTAFKVYYVLKGPPIDVMTEEEQRKREQDETLCRGYILNSKALRIEEETRIREKNLNGASSSKVNYVDSGKNNKGNDKTRKGTWNSSKDNKKDKKPLFEDESANVVEQVDTTEITAMVSKMNIGMIQELYMASVTTTDDWWYDSDATTHVCNNRYLFKTYKETEDGHEVMMGDNHTLKVIGSGHVEIQFTSGKKLTLMSVLHVPNIGKNLVSGFKLCKSGGKAMIESDKVIMSKANVFVGKAYACDGMFKLNINKITSSAYLLDCNFIPSFNIECSTFNLWHNRLGHINYRTMKDMLKQVIISNNGEHKDKCAICVQAKMKRKSFPKVDRQYEILELVHSGICELNGQLTRGGNRYFITFIDDCSRYTYVYLLKSKDRAFETFKIHKAEVENQRGKKIQILRSDRGGEYFSIEFFSYCESQDLDSNVIVESRDVDFFKNKFRHDPTSTNEIVTQIPQDISSPYLNYFNKRNMAESSSAPRRSERARKERNLDPDFIDSQAIIFLVEGDNENNEAIDDEMDSLVSNNTWKLLDLPSGFSQRQGVDYFDTYAPVARITSIMVLFALASIYNLPIHQMDVKTAFLNGDLDEEVYMKQPEGFVLSGHENKFTKDYGVILCLYVDDILIVGTNMEGINETKKSLSLCFQMKDMNEVDTILGIKVKRHKEANTPYESSCKLVENNGRAIAQIEYASAIGKEAEWLRNMLLDIELWPQPMPAISLHCDSQSTLLRAYNKVYNGKSRHISLRHAYIKELISNGIITIEYIRSCKNLADPFTKGLPKDIVFGTTREMGLKPIE